MKLYLLRFYCFYNYWLHLTGSSAPNNHQRRSTENSRNNTNNNLEPNNGKKVPSSSVATSKLAKVTKNNGYPVAAGVAAVGAGHSHRAITSPARQKRTHIISDFQHDVGQYQDGPDDDEQFYQQQQQQHMLKQQQKLLRQQQKEQQRLRQQITSSNNNVWVNRSQPHQLINYNNDDYDNTSNLVMETQQQPAFRSHKELKVIMFFQV